MIENNCLTNIALVGTSGNVGSHMLQSLLDAGKHNITVLTRNATTSLPTSPKLTTKVIDYANPQTLVSVLQGQDALIITLAGMAGDTAQFALIDAAIKARVPYVFPNEWCHDTRANPLSTELFIGPPKVKVQDYIKEKGNGVTSYIAIDCGFWYEWSLGITDCYGFDFGAKKVTFFDEGKQKVPTSTWLQIGRVVAGLVSLPVEVEDGVDVTEEKSTLEHYRNKNVYMSSFVISQRDMLESALRVTGDKESEWTVEHQGSKERFEGAVAVIKGGDSQQKSGASASETDERVKAVKMQEKVQAFMKLPARVFYPDGSGDYTQRRDTINEVLKLEQDDLDAATKRAMERWHANNGRMAHKH